MVAYLRISTNNPRSFLVISGINTNTHETLLLMRAIQTVWESNVERFFSRHELYYGKKAKTKPHTHLKDAFYCEIGKGSIIGRIDVDEAPYIKVLMFGAPPGSKAFIPSMGVRVKNGVWGGIPSMYWKTWQTFFQREVYALISMYGFDLEGKRKISRKVKRADISAVRAAEVERIRLTIRGMRIGIVR